MDKKRRLNILFILPEYYPHSGGGISTYYLHYIKALKPYCNKIKVIVGSGYTQANDEFIIDGVKIEYLKPELYAGYLNKFTRFDLMPGLKKSIAAAWAIYEQANQGEGFDIIECTDFGLGFIPWVINHQKPVITRMHGSTGQITLHEQNFDDALQNSLIQQTELLLLPLCDTLISHSTANKLAWETLIAKPVVKIAPVFAPSFPEALPFAKRGQYGMVTARVQVWKGPIRLCEAISTIGGQILPIKWFGRDMAYLNQASTSAYLKAHFPEVWGKYVLPQEALGTDDIKPLQMSAKFGLVPSTWDMFNFTCIEFMAAGTPVICSDGAGAAELIEHKKNGFKYPAEDVKALAECLKEVNNMTEQAYNNMAQAGIETIKNELSAEKLISQNIEQYERAAAAFKPNTANAFLDDIYKPSAKQHTLDPVLDKQPINTLLKYLFKRVRNKYTGKK